MARRHPRAWRRAAIRWGYTATMTHPACERVLEFWLGEIDDTGRASPEASARWWKKSAAFDREVAEQFAADHAAIAAGDCEHWLDTPRGRVAYVIVLDQLSRNMFRDSPRMYEMDERAVCVAADGIDAGCLDHLGYHECYFLLMPFMHAEDLERQDRGLALFKSLADRFPEHAAHVAKAVGFSQSHRDIVARFGRFPHRNEILGRPSTDEEVAFLETPGSSF